METSDAAPAGGADHVSRQVVVRGRVQGVGYRWACKREADRLGVTGWVRNRRDGAVELVAAGTTTAVDRLVAWCRSGPRGALVTAIDVEQATESPASSFEILL